MPFVYDTVTIGSPSSEYTVYANIEKADTYMAAAVGSAADNWRQSDADTKARGLVAATRLLDRQSWVGVKTDDDQDHAWPRTQTGVSGVVDDAIPINIVYASIELAAMINDGSTVQDAQNQSQQIQNLKAGSVSISYFRGADGLPLRFPLTVQEYLRPYLAGSTPALTGALSCGTDKKSITHDHLDFTRGF